MVKNKIKKRSRLKNAFLLFSTILISIILITGLYNLIKPLPEGISYKSPDYFIEDKDIDFLYDLTYISENDSKIYEQEIFASVFEIVEQANNYIIIDMFLFNSDYAEKKEFINLTQILERKLIEKKRNNSEIEIYFITDEINNFYGSYESDEIKNLKSNGVNVIITDLSKLRDSNPIYSSFYRVFLQWFGTMGEGNLAHPLGRDDKKVTIRSFLKLLNTKANHRKVIVADNNGSMVSLITSANPHTASSFHSNIAFLVRGNFGNELILSEKSVASFSSSNIDLDYNLNAPTQKEIKINLLTEKKIRDNILGDIDSLTQGDKINLAMFYLSDRKIINSILDASKRGVEINLILDPNKDAFAREKNGIPNRQVAHELIKKSNGKIKIRWYNTQGEQFHTKLLIINKKTGEVIIYGGSANYTKRNLNDLNLETSLRISSSKSTNISSEVNDYFNKIWSNDGVDYTLDFSNFNDDSLSKKIIYRFQEFTGLSTF